MLIEGTFPQVANAYRLTFGEFRGRMIQAAIIRGAKFHDEEIPDYTGFLAG